MSHQVGIDVRVRGRGRLNADELGEHLTASQQKNLTVDLAALTFIEPAGLVSVAVIIEDAVAAGREVTFRPPKDEDLAGYLARMRMGEHLDFLGVGHTLPQVHERRAGHRLVELRRFDGHDGLEALIETLIRTHVDDRPELIQPLYTALDEIAVNVLEHSGRSHGLVAMQRYDKRNDIAFAIGDSGVGLRARLSTVHPVQDDRLAVVRAAQTHVSTIDQPGRGRGIRRVIDLTGAHQGSVRLVSGHACGAFTGGHPDPQLTSVGGHFPGTLAHVRLSL